MHYYAVAGIPWYPIVEQDTGTLHLNRLDGENYRVHASAKPGEILTLTEPVRAHDRPGGPPELNPVDRVGP